MTSEEALSEEERRAIALSYGLLIGVGGLALIICMTRLYIRKFSMNMFGYDDWACLIALIFTMTFNILGCFIVKYGSGKHIQHVSNEDLAIWLKLYYVAMCLYLYVAMTVKMSLLLFFMRIFQKDWVQRICKGMMIFLVLFTVSGSLVLAFQCSPPRAAFDQTITNATCFSKFRLFQITLYQAVLMFAVDLAILILPMPVLISLKMPVRKTLAICLIVSTGIIASIAPVVRFSTLDYLLKGATDLTYDSDSSLYWMAVEFNLGLVAGSLSTLRRLPIFRMFASSTDPNSNNRTPGSLELARFGGRPSGGASNDRKKGRLNMGSSIIQATVVTANESQERIYIKDDVTVTAESLGRRSQQMNGSLREGGHESC